MCAGSCTARPSISNRISSRTLTMPRARSASSSGTTTACSRSAAGCAGLGHAEHAQLLDERRLPVVRLDLFGIQFLPGAEDDDFLLAAGDVEAAVGVEAAEVARAQPAVVERRGRGVGPAEVLAHHDRARGSGSRRSPPRPRRPRWRPHRVRCESSRPAGDGRPTS